MRNKYHIIFNLFLSFFALISVQTQVQAQETQKLAPNNIPVPWYSQKSRDVLTRIVLWLLR